jgi:hypothetical protein
VPQPYFDLDQRAAPQKLGDEVIVANVRDCEPSLTSTVREIRSKRMEWMRNKPQQKRVKLIVANDPKAV